MESNKKQKVVVDLTNEEGEEVVKNKNDEESDEESDDDTSDIDVDELTEKEILQLETGLGTDNVNWDISTRPPVCLKDTEKHHDGLYFKRSIRYFILPVGEGKTKRVKCMEQFGSRTEILDYVSNYYFNRMEFLIALIGLDIEKEALKQIIYKNHMAMDPNCGLDIDHEEHGTTFCGFEISKENEWTLLVGE
jgi:hypothetical protein